MPQVIKSRDPFNRLVFEGEVKISNRIKSLGDDEDNALGSEEEKIPREEYDEEKLISLREHYKREGVEYAEKIKAMADERLASAEKEAEALISKARIEAGETLSSAEANKKEILENARMEGYKAGYDAGNAKGGEDGYAQGLKRCEESLKELKAALENLEKAKADIFEENRGAIFDLAQSTAEKITATVFNQKDKAALKKMIAEAAKSFRGAKTIKVTLAAEDLSENVETDLETLEKCFPQSTRVEFEVLGDAESGTLIMESDSEILDAGISTQLKMIEELGRGKFREKDPDPEQQTKPLPDKPKRSSRKRSAETVSEEAPAQPPEAADGSPAEEAISEE